MFLKLGLQASFVVTSSEPDQCHLLSSSNEMTHQSATFNGNQSAAAGKQKTIMATL